jgi:hypothetical protein
MRRSIGTTAALYGAVRQSLHQITGAANAGQSIAVKGGGRIGPAIDGLAAAIDAAQLGKSVLA